MCVYSFAVTVFSYSEKHALLRLGCVIGDKFKAECFFEQAFEQKKLKWKDIKVRWNLLTPQQHILQPTYKETTLRGVGKDKTGERPWTSAWEGRLWPSRPSSWGTWWWRAWECSTWWAPGRKSGPSWKGENRNVSLWHKEVMKCRKSLFDDWS